MPAHDGSRSYALMLDPETLRTTLTAASLFVLAFEMFKDQVVEHLEFLHSSGFNEEGWILDHDFYRQDVLSRHRSRLQASLLWFKDNGALTDEDLVKVGELRSLRNSVVHELGDRVGTPFFLTVSQAFPELVAIFRKVEVWWIRNVEMDMDPEMAAEAVSDDDILPGSILKLRMLVETAFGEGDEAYKWYRAFVETEDAEPTGAPPEDSAPRQTPKPS